MKNILICDDSTFIRKRIRTILEEIEANYFEASDGEEALNIINTKVINVLILDLLMPKVTGKEVLAKIFLMSANLQVIVMSADIQASTIEFCKEKGVFAFLNKPPKANELVAKVKEALLKIN